MDINGVISIAEAIDPHANSFKSGSTRETRNEKWAFIIGCVYHGHPVYNPTPDPQWHIKSAGGGRPQSDDVTVSMPSRDYWDCVPGSGSDSAHFSDSYGGKLPAEQNVYAPPVPEGSEPVDPEEPTEPPVTTLPSYEDLGGDASGNKIGAYLFYDYTRAGVAPDAGMSIWMFRTCYDAIAGMDIDASITKHRAEWCGVLGIPVDDYVFP